MIHNLKAKGAAFSPTDGTRVADGTAGEGVAVCSCGWTSDVLPSGKQRILAHRDHRVAAEAEPTPDPEPTPAEPKVVRVFVSSRSRQPFTCTSCGVEYPKGSPSVYFFHRAVKTIRCVKDECAPTVSELTASRRNTP